jgi:L-threonylcarbamoyladenylate synthase
VILPGSDPAALAQAIERLRAGELVAIPTETVYGLAADALSDAAVARIFTAKGRPKNHPLIVHVAGSAQVADYAAEVPAFAQRLIDAFWPGPLTLILPRRAGVAAAAAGGQNTIGLRCPSHPVAHALLRELGTGLAAPSANRFGRVSPTTAAHVQAEFGDALLVLDGGACDVGIESTIVDCSRGVPVLLRPGCVTPAQIEAACGQALVPAAALAQAAPRASGTLASHYAPQAKLELLDAGQIQERLKNAVAGEDVGVGVGVGLWSRQQPSPQSPHGSPIWRQQPLDAASAAHQLFAVLRELDALGVTRIWVEAPPAGADWDGVRDRLERAAA